jgi:hypothetical protein
MDSTDDFMGRCVILPTDCALVDQAEFINDHSKEVPAVPRWHPVKFAEGEP